MGGDPKAYYNYNKLYQELQVQTLPQEKLVLMLYDGALKFIEQAREALQAKRYEETNYNLSRAQDIINELQVTLNLEVGAVAHNLYALYDFMYRRLIEANVKKSTMAMDEVRSLLSDLRQTWEEATRIYHSHNYQTHPGGLNLIG